MRHESKEQIRQEIAAIKDKLNYLLSLLDDGLEESLSGDKVAEIKDEDIPVVEIQVDLAKASK